MKKDIEQGQLFLSYTAALPADSTTPKLQFLLDHTVTFFSFQTHNQTCNLCPANYYSSYQRQRSYYNDSCIDAEPLETRAWVPIVFAHLSREGKEALDYIIRIDQVILDLQGGGVSVYIYVHKAPF